jgi:hypothetical protein
MLIEVIHDSIRSHFDYNGGYLRFWGFQGSKDGLSEVEIDDRRNDTSLNRKEVIATFSISSESQKEFQMIRLRECD